MIIRAYSNTRRDDYIYGEHVELLLTIVKKQEETTLKYNTYSNCINMNRDIDTLYIQWHVDVHALLVWKVECNVMAKMDS